MVVLLATDAADIRDSGVVGDAGAALGAEVGVAVTVAADATGSGT